MWENVARTVLMIKAPKGAPGLPEGSVAGVRCDRITSLMDIFPTLLELTGLPMKDGLDGNSLAPLLKDPDARWDYPAITTYDFWEFSVRVQDWRYVRYIDDSEELYDHRSDPEEWRNLADDPRYLEIKSELARHIPANPAPFVDTSYKIEPHHFPPYKSKEDYALRRGRESTFK